MGWFWADTTPTAAAPAPLSHRSPSHPAAQGASGAPPPSCPMHNRTVDAFNPAGASSSKATPPSSCPVAHDKISKSPFASASSPSPSSPAPPPATEPSTLSKLNPLNYMFHTISQAPSPNQSHALPTEREISTIPRGTPDGETWEYPSPQQMYNALLRKGYSDTDASAVESMVAVHNFLNEGAWSEIVEWERRFGKGLMRGWGLVRRGEEHAPELVAQREREEGEETTPALVRFQGRPKDMTPKAAAIQVLGRLYPAKFGTEPPFDRHDWFVRRTVNGQERQVRYVIDYYSGEPEPTGEPVFYLDVRPAMTPTGAVERLMRWGGDVWWRASGGDARESTPTGVPSQK